MENNTKYFVKKSSTLSSEFVALLKLDWTIISASPSSKEILGYSDFEIQSKNIYDLIDPEDLKILKANHIKSISGNDGVMKIRLLNKNGTYSLMQFYYAPVRDANNEIIYIQVIVRKIADKDHHRFNLNTLKNIFSYFPYGTLIQDNEGFFIYANNRALNILDKDNSEIFMKRSAEVFKDALLNNKLKFDAELLPMEFSYNLNLPAINLVAGIKNKQGELKNIYISTFPIANDEEEGAFIYLTILREKTNEEDYEKINNNLQRITELNKNNKAFISYLTHDLTNLFISIKGYSEILIEDYDELNKEQIKEYLENIKKSSDFLLNFINDVPEKWNEKNNELYGTKNIIIENILKSIYLLFKGLIEKKRISFKIKNNPETKIKCNENALFTILQNIIHNAIKFTNTEGSIEVLVLEAADKINITVTNTGELISKEKIEEIYYSKNNTSSLGTNGEQGKGKGLKIVNEHMGKIQGKLEIDSNPKKGTSFKIIIPK